LGRQKSPQTAGFRELATSLHLPISLFRAAKLPKLSSQLRKYSRFPETAAGDLVRSPLPGDGGSSMVTLMRFL